MGRSRSVSKRLDQPADTDVPGERRARTRARDVARDEGVSNLQALQRVLYRSAKQDPTRRFHALYDKLTRSDVMWQRGSTWPPTTVRPASTGSRLTRSKPGGQ